MRGSPRGNVRQVWAASYLKPHRLKIFKISNDLHFADKVVDMVGLYLIPLVNALVLAVDEKTPIQALDRTQPMLPKLNVGRMITIASTVRLSAAFDIITDQVNGRIT